MAYLAPLPYIREYFTPIHLGLIYIFILADLFYSKATLEIPDGNQAVPKVILFGLDQISGLLYALVLSYISNFLSGLCWISC